MQKNLNKLEKKYFEELELIIIDMINNQVVNDTNYINKVINNGFKALDLCSKIQGLVKLKEKSDKSFISTIIKKMDRQKKMIRLILEKYIRELPTFNKKKRKLSDISNSVNNNEIQPKKKKRKKI